MQQHHKENFQIYLVYEDNSKLFDRVSSLIVQDGSVRVWGSSYKRFGETASQIKNVISDDSIDMFFVLSAGRETIGQLARCNPNKVIFIDKLASKYINDAEGLAQKIIEIYYETIYKYTYEANIKLHKEIIFPNESDILFIPGKNFVINNNNNLLIHFVTEVIGQFLYLKKIYPDLQLSIIKEDPSVNNTKLVDFAIDYMGAKVINAYEYNRVIFEHIPYIFAETNNAILGITKNNSLLDYPAAIVQDKFVGILKDFFKSLPKSHTSYKKVFLNSFKRTTQDGRDISDAEYQMAIDFFRDNGYEIINQSDLSFIDQINLVANATHIASFAGGPSAFSLMAKPEANFILLNPNWERYYSHHTRLVKQCCNSFYYPMSVADAIALMKTRDRGKI